jgi:hypothetical protein
MHTHVSQRHHRIASVILSIPPPSHTALAACTRHTRMRALASDPAWHALSRHPIQACCQSTWLALLLDTTNRRQSVAQSEIHCFLHMHLCHITLHCLAYVRHYHHQQIGLYKLLACIATCQWMQSDSDPCTGCCLTDSLTFNVGLIGIHCLWWYTPHHNTTPNQPIRLDSTLRLVVVVVVVGCILEVDRTPRRSSCCTIDATLHSCELVNQRHSTIVQAMDEALLAVT